MYSTKDLAHEVASQIADLVARKEGVLQPEWIAKAVVNTHPDIEGEDAPFYLCCGLEQARGEVRKQLNRFKLKPDPAPDRQLIMAGFERVQEYYFCVRDEAQLAVRTEHMSDDELQQKILELEAMAAGCLEHAEELRRYLATRGTRSTGINSST